MGSNLARDDGYLRALKICSMTLSHVERFYGMLKIPKYMKIVGKFMAISPQVSPALATSCLCWYLPELWWINHK
jgi:hypothetical protein